jgi:ABC-2 type transport system permease protein
VPLLQPRRRPRRLRLLAAKITVIGVAALLAGELTTFTMFFAGQGLLRSAGAPSTTLGQPGVARAVAATGIFLALLSLLGTGCGTVFRRSTADITAYIVINFLTFLIPPGNKYSPEIMLLNSVSAVRSINAANGFLPPGWVSVALLACYTATALLAGAVLLTQRDA